MKNTDKVTLTIGQLKKLVSEAEELNTYLVVYINNQRGTDNSNRHKQITIDAKTIKEALDEFIREVDYTEILKIERLY